MDNSLTKEERLNSKLIIDQLFAGGNASMAAFPLRIVYMKVDKATDCRLRNAQGPARELPPVSIMVSVPKRRFHHAVDRNRMKRLVREAYRINKHVLWRALADKDYRLVIAFVSLADSMPSYRTVEKSVRKALARVAERVD